MVVYTAGYEGKSIDEFVGRLRDHGITVLVDIRELPISRKPGFSKSAIRNVLNEANIDYVHLRELGSPRTIRKELRASGDYPRFFALYRNHLEGQDQAFKELISLVTQNIACLMCFEEEPRLCHRSVVVEKLYNGGIEVRHL